MEMLTIYTSESCHYCKQIKEVLMRNKIDYTEKTTTDFNKEWNNIVDLLGSNMLPTILFKGNYLTPGRDFNNPQDILTYMKDFTLTEHSVEHKTLERLRTLNYSIHLAFRNLDGILREIDRKINLLEQKEENEHKSTS